MNLTLDANILVNELTRDGELRHSIIMHPTLRRLFIAEHTWDEAIHVIDNRLRRWVRSGRLDAPAADRFKTMTTICAESRCTIVAHRLYASLEREARMRVPGDPDDWHTVAVAMATETAIWTLDQEALLWLRHDHLEHERPARGAHDWGGSRIAEADNLSFMPLGSPAKRGAMGAPTSERRSARR